MVRRYFLLALSACLLVAGSIAISAAADQKAPPITQVNVQVLGPQRLGPLPPVIAPPGNPPSSAEDPPGQGALFRYPALGRRHGQLRHLPQSGPGLVRRGPDEQGHPRPARRPPGAAGLQRRLQPAPVLGRPLAVARGPGQGADPEPDRDGQHPPGHDPDRRPRSPATIEEFKAVFGEGPITVDQVADAIAAFERTVVTTDSRFDRYARGDHQALTPLEKQGLEIFNGKGHCTSCHWGPYFSDGRFHNLGVPAKDPKNPDLGRYDVTKDPRDMGAFKTPTVRDAARRAPYLHDGSEKTLESLIDFYDRGGGKDPNLDPLMVPLGLTKHEKNALVAFIKALDSLNPEVADVKPIAPGGLAASEEGAMKKTTDRHLRPSFSPFSSSARPRWPSRPSPASTASTATCATSPSPSSTTSASASATTATRSPGQAGPREDRLRNRHPARPADHRRVLASTTATDRHDRRLPPLRPGPAGRRRPPQEHLLPVRLHAAHRRTGRRFHRPRQRRQSRPSSRPSNRPTSSSATSSGTSSTCASAASSRASSCSAPSASTTSCSRSRSTASPARGTASISRPTRSASRPRPLQAGPQVRPGLHQRQRGQSRQQQVQRPLFRPVQDLRQGRGPVGRAARRRLRLSRLAADRLSAAPIVSPAGRHQRPEPTGPSTASAATSA